MSKWVWKGLKTGKKTTLYPKIAEAAPGVSPGLPDVPADTTTGTSLVCPRGVFDTMGAGGTVDVRRCVHCFHCVRSAPATAGWQEGYEWGRLAEAGESGHRRLGKAFSHSLHIRMVDAGACDACISEVRQIGKPYYNIHRLGFFITPTPRQADVLLVVGPVSDNMELPLKKAYEAMPTPKLVVAAGTCALSGCVFGPSFASRGGVAEMLPVTVEIPGCPPPPLAIIHGLLVAVGRKPAAASTTPRTAGLKRSVS